MYTLYSKHMFNVVYTICDWFWLYSPQSIAGKIDLQGNVTFHNNTVDGSFGGALYLLSSSQVVLQDNTHVMFTNNNGRYVILRISYTFIKPTNK